MLRSGNSVFFSNIGSTSSDNAVLHRETLRNYELVVASTFIAESRMFFCDQEARLLDCPDDTWCFSYFCSRFDGVNNDHGKQCKYQTLELDARYVFGPDFTDVEDFVVWAEPAQLSCGTCNECFRVTMHQLNLLGCPAYTIRESNNTPRHLATAINTTDGGESGTRGKMKRHVKPYTYTLDFENDCAQHGISNASRRSLTLSDELAVRWQLKHKPFATVVKGYHIWRKYIKYIDPSWRKMFPPNAQAVLKRLPEKAVATRWGSEHGATAFFVVEPDPHEVVAGMKAGVKLSKTKQKYAIRNRPTKPSAQPTDDIQLDENQQWTEKLNKWETGDCASIGNKLHWS